MDFELVSSFKPKGSQPEAIKKLVQGLKDKSNFQTLLGVTGSGKSLAYDERITIRAKDGTINNLPIGEFVESNLKKPNRINDSSYQSIKGFNILSINPATFKIEESEIREISKHIEKKLYEVTLDDNSSIKITKDHNCFVFDELSLELKKTSELKIGDYIPLSNLTMYSKKRLDHINLLDYVDIKLNIKLLIHKYDPTYVIIKSVLTHPAPNFKIKQILNETGQRGITKTEFYNFINKAEIDIKKNNKLIKLITGGQDKINPILEITEDMLTFLGLYVAEGHNTGKYVIISNSNNILQEKCKNFFNSLGLHYYQRNRNDIAYFSILITKLLRQFGSNADEKKIPSFIYNLSNKDLSIFLQAIFDGDGWVEPNSIHLGSNSRQLLFSIKELLLRYNITSRINLKKGKKIFYKLNISGHDNLQNFIGAIGFSIDYKLKKSLRTIKNNKNTNVDLIPNLSDSIKKIRVIYSLYQKDLANILNCERSYISMIEHGNRIISKVLFNKLVDWLIKRNKRYSYLKNIKFLNFRRIISIKEVFNNNGYVYDLSVKGNETFFAGSGSILVHNTFTIANVIAQTNRPALVLAHNKTLAAQLFNEFKEFFPKNRVEYFVSYYDYYQPESYIPAKDMYIEKDSQINPKIEQMRLSATASVLKRRDVIIVASVSSIYNIGDPKHYEGMGFEISVGQNIKRNHLLQRLIDIQFERNDLELMPGRFRVKGDTVDIIPGDYFNIIRVEFFGDEIEKISELDKVTSTPLEKKGYYFLFPARHFVIPDEEKNKAIILIKQDLEKRLPELGIIEAHRLKQRTLFDLEMVQETGFCKGIENYTRYFDGRKPGQRPFCLLDYMPKDFLFIIDESHQSLPQLHGMYNGDKSRKQTLVDYGFRLPSALDNRPMKFEETELFFKNVIFVSATPGPYELEHSTQVVEQIVRPTGLIDPEVEVRPIKGQIEDLMKNILATIEKKDRCLVTTLTKKLAEELSEFLAAKNIKTRYLHSEIDTLERTEIIRQLRLGKFDVLVGINLLREGLDIPEVGFIGILDADKEGFLRDQKSLIQIIGRAARNVNSKVILYADRMTDSINGALMETKRRREMQIFYNKEHHITPETIIKPIKEKEIDLKDTKHIPKAEIPNLLIELETEMKKAAEKLDFEVAIMLREKINSYKRRID